MARPVRIERACGDLFGEEGADVRAQRFALGRQAHLVELQSAHRDATNGQKSSAPAFATRRPNSAAHQLSLPKSSRQPSMRNVKRCNTCSCGKPMAPNT